MSDDDRIVSLLAEAAELWASTFPTSPEGHSSAHPFVLLAETEAFIALGESAPFRERARRATQKRASRPAIPLVLRMAVYERDGFRCTACPATEDLTLDHIVPWSLGGPDTWDNLQTLCRSCNSRKGATI